MGDIPVGPIIVEVYALCEIAVGGPAAVGGISYGPGGDEV